MKHVYILRQISNLNDRNDYWSFILRGIFIQLVVRNSKFTYISIKSDHFVLKMAVNLVGGLQNLFDKRHGSQSDNFATLEDFSDRLNRFYTSTILLILAGVTVANVYFLKAISCNLPHSQSTPGFSTFAESVCWVQGTIGLDKTDRIPANKTEWDQLREKSDICKFT